VLSITDQEVQDHDPLIALLLGTASARLAGFAMFPANVSAA
jgi:hypothetical protein